MAREFGSQGSLTVDTPSLLQRRDAIMGMANEARTERNLFKRTFRELNRRSRRGDADAGLDAIKLYDMAQERGVEMTGIPSVNKGFDAAATELRDQQEFNARAQGLTNAPNETITTPPQFSDNPIVGGEAGIEVQRNVAGPSAAQGGMLGAARRASTPLWSSRYNSASDPGAPISSPAMRFDSEGRVLGGDKSSELGIISEEDQAALNAAATPMDNNLPDTRDTGLRREVNIDPRYGGGVGFGESLDQQFRRKYPNSSRLMDRMSQSQSRPPLTASLPSPQGVFQYPPRIGNSSRLPGRSSDGLMRAQRFSRTA